MRRCAGRAERSHGLHAHAPVRVRHRQLAEAFRRLALPERGPYGEPLGRQRPHFGIVVCEAREEEHAEGCVRPLGRGAEERIGQRAPGRRVAGCLGG